MRLCATQTKVDNLLLGTKSMGMRSLGVVVGGWHHMHLESM